MPPDRTVTGAFDFVKLVNDLVEVELLRDLEEVLEEPKTDEVVDVTTIVLFDSLGTLVVVFTTDLTVKVLLDNLGALVEAKVDAPKVDFVDFGEMS